MQKDFENGVGDKRQISPARSGESIKKRKKSKNDVRCNSRRGGKHPKCQWARASVDEVAVMDHRNLTPALLTEAKLSSNSLAIELPPVAEAREMAVGEP